MIDNLVNKKACNKEHCNNPECVCGPDCDDDCFSTEIVRKNGFFQIQIPYFIFDLDDDDIIRHAGKTFAYLKNNHDGHKVRKVDDETN